MGRVFSDAGNAWWPFGEKPLSHYNDVIMSIMASEVTSLTIVYSTFYSGVDQRKHQTSASLAFLRGIQRNRWNPHTKRQEHGKCFHLMTSSCERMMIIVNWPHRNTYEFWIKIQKFSVKKIHLNTSQLDKFYVYATAILWSSLGSPFRYLTM